MRSRRRCRAKFFSTAVFAAGVAAAALGFAGAPALAQGYFLWDDDEPRIAPTRESKPRPQSPRVTTKKKYGRVEAEKAGAPPAREAGPVIERPLFAIASIADQHVSIYNHHGLVARSAISTGIAGHSTPKGIFTIIGRERFHRSNIYSGAPMPFMQRITWSGIAMHLGVVPGHPASHGCIRLPAEFAAKLWGLTKIGERVVISPRDVTPVEFEHPLLPAPKMRVQAEADKAAPAVDAPSAPAADQPPINAQQHAEQLKVEAVAEAGLADQAASAADQPLVNTRQHAEQPKAETVAEAGVADEAAPAVDAKQTPAAARPLINPRQYAEQLKIKTVAAAVAAGKAVKAMSAAVEVKRQETARSDAELRAAEAAHESARSKADAAAKAYDAAAAAAASQQEAAQAAERNAAAGDVLAKAKADRLTRAYGKAVIAEDAAASAKTNAATTLAAAAAKLEGAKAVSTAKDAELADAVWRLNEATAASAAAANAEKEARRLATPVSVLVSKKDRRIYVRQGLAAVFDAPVEVRDPQTPLGTHLYLATAAKDDGASLKWSVVSMPAQAAEEQGERKKNYAMAEDSGGMSWRSGGSVSTPAEALERIEIAQDVRDRIAERLWTGGSLIISDQPLSGETGNDGTDLTIKLR